MHRCIKWWSRLVYTLHMPCIVLHVCAKKVLSQGVKLLAQICFEIVENATAVFQARSYNTLCLQSQVTAPESFLFVSSAMGWRNERGFKARQFRLLNTHGILPVNAMLQRWLSQGCSLTPTLQREVWVIILGYPWWLINKKPHLRCHALLLHCMGLWTLDWGGKFNLWD